MQITYLGHAGFCAENEDVVIIMDPWLSASGAYDYSWFQFPRNHHLADTVRLKLNEPGRKKYIYISHEHKDHFDPGFLDTLDTSDFTFIIGDFRRTVLKDLLKRYKTKGIIACNDSEKTEIPGGYVQLFLDDTELNRDSAILVSLKGTTFLNFNDCKKLDEIYKIKSDTGQIDIFACQYSGATWHPTCYEYTKKEYELISRKKSVSRFESVARAIKAAEPKTYLPSAGPPCFLDPLLYSINFEPVNIFPRSDKITAFLSKRLKNENILFPEIFPGDVIDSVSGKIISKGTDIITNENFKEYLDAYAADYKEYFSNRKSSYTAEEFEAVLAGLKTELEEKLASLSLASRINVPVYFILNDYESKILRIDFSANTVEYSDSIKELNYYSIAAPSWEVARVLAGILTWDDFSLTFRMRLNRKPDVYQKIIEAFLVLEKEDMNAFCERLLEIESKKERIIIEAGGCRYSIDRFCPHEGGDLERAWLEDDRYLVCPRHTWKYDLFSDGKCTTNDTSINAVILEND